MATDKTLSTYDFIVVGAGTSGSVLATRLTEDPNTTVLVLEAGQNHNEDERVYNPGLGVGLLGDDEMDWKYVSQEQPGLNGRQMKHPRGKLIGGTSAINSFALIYPSKAGLDIWADLGNEGWDWNGIKEYYKKFQTIKRPNEAIKKDLNVAHNEENIEKTTGPIEASFPMEKTRKHTTWIETFRNLDLDMKSDPLDGSTIGGHTSTCHVTDKKRERSHAGIFLMKIADERPNLHVMAGTHVQRVVFDKQGEDKAVATGVSCIDEHGKMSFVSAKKEVLLAAGAFGSPQLLELSGIGEPSLLEKNGIPLVYANSNVGENLQDHIRTGLSFEAKDRWNTTTAEEARRLYQESRTGPLADRLAQSFAYMPLVQFMTEEQKTSLTKAIDTYITTTKATPFEQKRNEFIRQMTLSPTEASAVAYLAGKPAVLEHATEGKEWISFFSMLAHPFSKGSSHIASPDPHVPPLIDMGYYTNPLDLEIHGLHLGALEKLASTEPMASLIVANGARLPVESQNGLRSTDPKRILKSYGLTNYHPCGTCSMLPEDIGGVVDSRLRVYGTINVRVVDASIMPIIPRGNIITSVYAVAEKAADLVKEDLKNARSR